MCTYYVQCPQPNDRRSDTRRLLSWCDELRSASTNAKTEEDEQLQVNRRPTTSCRKLFGIATASKWTSVVTCTCKLIATDKALICGNKNETKKAA